MTNHLNLMTEMARFRVASRSQLRRWGAALAVVAAALALPAAARWVQWRKVQQRHEAMEAGYTPVRRLNQLNRRLRNEAISLVRDEKLPLELSRNRPVATLLGHASQAAALTKGELFIEHISVEQRLPGTPGDAGVQGRLILETACTLTYDIAEFVSALRRQPFSDVKVTADEVIAVNGVDRKSYTIECVF